MDGLALMVMPLTEKMVAARQLSLLSWYAQRRESTSGSKGSMVPEACQEITKGVRNTSRTLSKIDAPLRPLKAPKNCSILRFVEFLKGVVNWDTIPHELCPTNFALALFFC